MFESLAPTIESVVTNLKDRVTYGIVQDVQIGLDSFMGKSYDIPKDISEITDPKEIAKIYESDIMERIDIDNSKFGISDRYRKYWISQLERELVDDIDFRSASDYEEEIGAWEDKMIASLTDDEKAEMISHYTDKAICSKMAKLLNYEMDELNKEPLLLKASSEDAKTVSSKSSKSEVKKKDTEVQGSSENNDDVAKMVENVVVKPKEDDKSLNEDEAQVIKIGNIEIDTAIEPVIFDTPPNNIPTGNVVIPQPIVVEQPGFGNHRVDTPPKPKVPKAEPDKVEMDLPDIKVECITNSAVKPDIIQSTPISVPDNKSPIPEVLPNERNKDVILQYPYLAEIEKVANKNNIMLEMQLNPNAANKDFSGIIICQAYNADNGQFNVFKTFGIDTGVIIDTRIKLIINRDMKPESYYEDMHYYSLFDKVKDESGKNQKKSLDLRLLDDFFKGGFDNISKKEMFPQDIMELNKIVSLITVPSGTGMYNEIRKQLLEAMKNGDFGFMIPNAAGITKDGSICMRFAVVDSNPHNKEFILSSVGVPYRHAFPYTSTKDANMYFSPGKKPRLEYLV